MDIIFYKNKSPLNNVSRVLSDAVTKSGFLREGSDILSPDVTLEYNSTFLTYNYAYIADYGRYYYYNGAPSIEGKTMVVHLKADSLYNYLSEVLAADCIAERSSSNYNMFLKDSALLGEVGYKYFSRSFTGGASFTPERGKYILMTGGQ